MFLEPTCFALTIGIICNLEEKKEACSHNYYVALPIA